MSAVRRRWRFEGRVQGVGFRYFSACAAQKLSLTGWVANNWDGSVTLEAQGEPAQLDKLVPLIEKTCRCRRAGSGSISKTEFFVVFYNVIILQACFMFHGEPPFQKIHMNFHTFYSSM